ncbi:hypothetical protein FBEOM_8267 [Fusarium beomiforme]|uniref:Uncharacterized protein n=1 Tax=Fusarium beomiforme TaxID=44412 RepID=A0A9P5DUI0_9HYPO|nr:hypothetical protein FBEOM_8267 [Fusarium beomiforme]
MRHRVYTPRELLRLRHRPPQKDIYVKLASKVREDSELGEIIRIVERPLSLIIEECNSSDSDEMHRRPTQQLDGTDSERKYRGRSDSEVDRAPVVAPADLATQKSEGFQKFYNSVVSPTHVRVTAGGRIVPNTRGPHSPTSKWNRERSSIDGQNQPRNMNGTQPEGVAYPVFPPSWGHFAPVVPPPAPGTLPGMALRPEGLPFMPPPPMDYNLATVSYNQFPPPGFPIQLPSQAVPYGKLPDTGMEQARGIHLSPTEQFDQSRPFLYNGQWWIANGGALYPISMPPQINFAPPPVPSPSAPRPGGDFNISSARYGRPSSRQPNTLPFRLQNDRSASPPVSSIRPSSITQKQLEVLRSQKRYHEDQLRYNKHQIDARDMEERLQHICREIKHFERMLATQLEFEARKYPKVGSPDGPPSNSSNDYANSNSESDNPNTADPGHRSGFENQSRTDKLNIRSVSAHSQLKSTTPVTSAKDFSKAAKSDEVQHRKPSSLPVNAALAPVFQPRSDLGTSVVAADEEDEVDETAQPRQYEHLTKKAEGWRTFFREKLESDKNMGPPYLIGKLKPGVQPERARETDYVYNRELTADEKRAQVMYWGRAPFIFETGLPLYDGKNFYEPRVIREEPMSSGESVFQNASEPNESKTSPAKPNEADPFHAVPEATRSSVRYGFDDATRSESLHRTDSLQGSSFSEVPRSESHVSHPGSRYLEFRRIINEHTRNPIEKFRAKVSDDSGDEEGNLIFKGRRVDRDASKYPKDIWSTMRKNGKTSANVVAGQVSPMTAQGVLPHYAGHATASLTPAATTNSRGCSAKLGDVNDSQTANISVGRREENRRPLELLDEQLRSVSLQDKSHHGFSTR